MRLTLALASSSPPPRPSALASAHPNQVLINGVTVTLKFCVACGIQARHRTAPHRTAPCASHSPPTHSPDTRTRVRSVSPVILTRPAQNHAGVPVPEATVASHVISPYPISRCSRRARGRPRRALTRRSPSLAARPHSPPRAVALGLSSRKYQGWACRAGLAGLATRSPRASEPMLALRRGASRWFVARTPGGPNAARGGCAPHTPA